MATMEELREIVKEGYKKWAEENEKTVEGIEVIGIDDLKNGREYLFILCAMDLEARQNMEKNLKFRGYYHLCCINTDMIYQAGFF